ncbi:MAG: hypothetical protein ACREO8_01790 [Luteimonas sp.]
MIRSRPVIPPQLLDWPQKRLVSGPQSAMVVLVQRPVHTLLTEIAAPQPRRGRLMPQSVGRVILKQACEVFGQALCRLPDLQLPQAPPPAAAQRPNAGPQQNQVATPVLDTVEQLMAFLLRRLVNDDFPVRRVERPG